MRDDIEINKDFIKYKNIASAIAILMLLLAIPSGIWPYGYYVLLRWIVTATSLLILWSAFNLGKRFWVVLMALIAILFNPLLPIHLSKETWVVIDLFTAGLFLLSIFIIKIDNEKLIEKQH